MTDILALVMRDIFDNDKNEAAKSPKFEIT